MDDFRVGSISQYEPYRDDQPAGGIGQKKERRHKPSDNLEDGFESAADQADTAADDADGQADTGENAQPEPQDYYTPSEPVDE